MVNKRDFFENYQPLQNFQTLNPTDREKYLKLYSRYTMEELHKKLAMDGSDPTISDLILKLYGIYETNKFKGGVGIQAARLVCNSIYRISSYSFLGNYSFLNFVLCTVTFAHSTYRCGNYSREETIQGRKLFAEIRYVHSKK